MNQKKDYYGQINLDLLNRIPCISKHILEVGCGAGALGEAYKKINPDAKYFGIEMMSEPARSAREKLDYVWECNVEDTHSYNLTDKVNSFDTIVYGDVLEHLINPEKVIEYHKTLLSEDGLILACIPNVQNWSAILNLLQGSWPQNDQGLFDRTHLRWFTKQSIVKLFERVNLQIIDITPRIFDLDKAKALTHALKPTLESLNIDSTKFLRESAPLQYVVRAQNKRTRQILIHGLMLPKEIGMNDVRMINPLKSVGSVPQILIQLSHGRIDLKSDYLGPKIMIWQRQIVDKSALLKIKKIIDAGWLIISEFDDHPNAFDLIKENNYLTFRAFHACQVSTENLKKAIIAYNPETTVFANCIDKIPDTNNKWEKVLSGKDRLRIFFGAVNRENDWKSWISAFNNLNGSYLDAVEFEVIHDRKFFDSLNSSLKSFTPACDYEQYNDILKSCHVALLPLLDTEFNRAKSDLKFIESSSHMTATISSPTVYSETVKDNYTGKLLNDPNMLQTIIEEWIDRPRIPYQLAKQAREWTINNRLQSQQTPERVKWYTELWNNKDELNKSLLQRVPELN